MNDGNTLINIPKNLPSPAFSEPPMGSKAASRPVTLPDVLMRIAHDGPMYALIIMVGIAMLKGSTSSSEMIIAGLGSLLARSWPRAIQVNTGDHA